MVHSGDRGTPNRTKVQHDSTISANSNNIRVTNGSRKSSVIEEEVMENRLTMMFVEQEQADKDTIVAETLIYQKEDKQ